MRVRVVLLTLLVSLVVIYSCQKESSFDLSPAVPDPEPVDTVPHVPPSVPPDNQVIASFMGRILDEKGNAMKDAEVTVGNKKAFSDEYGVFRIKDAVVAQQSSFITVAKAGYLNGSRTVASIPDGNAFVQIKMLRKVLKATFNSFDGASVNIGTLSKVDFPADAFAYSSGEAYLGKVLVYGAEYDPTSADFADIMPGDLRGITADSQTTALRSFGMVNVLLESSSGEPLQIAKGYTAHISMQVSSALVKDAPSEIPLWHFSETDGKWREEGKAVLSDGRYSGDVSHFSTWNLDLPFRYVFVKLRVVGAKGNYVPYKTVRIIDEGNYTYGVSKSDSLGYALIIAPQDKPFKAEVRNECDIILGSKNYNAVSADTDLGRIQFTQDRAIYIQGKVFSCSGPFDQPGFVRMFADGLYYSAEIWDGSYQLALNTCFQRRTSATILAYDANAENNSGPVELSIDGANTKAPDLTICKNNLDVFLKYQFDNNDLVLITTPPDSSNCVKYSMIQTKIEFFKGRNVLETGQGLFVYFSLWDTVPHVRETGEFMLIDNKVQYSAINDSSMHYEVTEYGKPDEYVRLKFSGKIYNRTSPSETHTISGECRVRRRYAPFDPRPQ